MKRLLSILLLLIPCAAMADDIGDITVSRRNAANTRYENYRIAIPAGDGVLTFSSGSAVPVWRTNAQFLADLSLEIGTDLQAWNAKLDTFAALADGTNGYQLTTNGAGGLSWAASGSGTGAFSDSGDPVILNTTTKDVAIGAAAINTAKLSVDGDADQVQLAIQGHSTQTAKLVELENSGGTIVGSIDINGNIVMGTSFVVTPVSLVDGFTGLYQGQIGYDDGTNDMIIDFGTAANQTVTMPPHTGTLATLAGSETLTNKSIAASQLTGIIADARMPDLTGDVTTIEGAVATTIANDAITNAKMADDAIDSAEIADGAVDLVHLANDASRIVTKSTAANYTVGTTASRESYGGVVYVTAAATITLPAIADGMSVTVITVGAVAVSVDVNASDKMVLDGVTLDDGDKATNTSTTGDMIVFTYYSADGWYAASDGWTDTGA